MVLQIILMFYLLMVKGQSLNDSNTLVRDLLSDYQKYSRPVKNQNDSVNVTVGMWLMSIKEFDEVQESFSYVATLLFKWLDEGMAWNASEYGGIYKVFISWEEVWTPPVVLSNPSDDVMSFGRDWQNIRYMNSGYAYWVTSSLLETSCKVNARGFPFDTQTCTTSLQMPEVQKSEIMLRVHKLGRIVLTGYKGHGEWALLKTSSQTKEGSDYNYVEFTFYLKRKPQFFIMNIILPISFLGLLNVLVFVLVPESGERVSFCITVLLSIAVFMTIVSETLPKSFEPIPIISYKLMADMILSSLITVVTILNIGIFNKLETVRKPRWVMALYNCMCRHQCIKCKEMHVKKSDKALSDSVHVIDERVLSAIDVHVEVTHKQEKHSEACHNNVTWKDISRMVDKISLMLFALTYVGSLGIFFILTTTA